MVYELSDTSKAAVLFGDWPETLVTSCLQKVMGKVYVTDLEQPKSALAYVGCFAFYAGEPDRELVVHNLAGFVIMTPQNEAWANLINCKDLEERKEDLERRRDDLADLFSNERAILENEQTLSQEYDRLSEEIIRLEKSITERKRKKRRISEFIKALEASGEEFSEIDWCIMVEKVTVFKEKMVFLLTSGAEVEV